MHRHLLILAALLISLPACQADQNGATAVSGTVREQPFDSLSGFAEFFDGEYVITLTDDPNFTCTSNPFGDYLTVEMFNVDGSGSFAAVGNVTFSEVAGDLVEQEGAQSGSFDVTVVEDSVGQELLQGSLSAGGPTSSVSGTFEVPVCD